MNAMTIPAKTARHTITVTSEQPNVAGEITLRLLDGYSKCDMEVRRGILAQPLRWEDLPMSGRSLLTCIATLEYVIVTAPAGWYAPDPKTGVPILRPGEIIEPDNVSLWQVYSAYDEWENSFRPKPADVATPENPPSNALDVGDEQNSRREPT